MTMVIVLVVLAILTFVAASGLFGADSRGHDARGAMPDWPGMRHGN